MLIRSGFICAVLFVTTTLAPPALAQPAVSDRVVKTVCASAIGYDDLEQLKDDLLLAAKREAANELFGELIAAATTVENLVVTTDQIRVQSLGLIRVEGSAAYANGPNLAEVCVTVTAYFTAQDRAQFVAETIDGRACVTDAALSVRELRSRAETAARIKALAEYDVRLAGYSDDAILPLLRKVSYAESALLPGTETYCAHATGMVVPIEVVAYLQVTDRNEEIPNIAAPTASSVTVQPLSLNVRTGPGRSHSVTERVTQNQKLLVMGRSSDGVWFQVETPTGHVGWVMQEFVSRVADVGSVPVVPNTEE